MRRRWNSSWSRATRSTSLPAGRTRLNLWTPPYRSTFSSATNGRRTAVIDPAHVARSSPCPRVSVSLRLLSSCQDFEPRGGLCYSDSLSGVYEKAIPIHLERQLFRLAVDLCRRALHSKHGDVEPAERSRLDCSPDRRASLRRGRNLCGSGGAAAAPRRSPGDQQSAGQQ